MKLPSKSTLLAASLFALSAPVGQAATLTWTGNASNDLATAGNWSPNQTPAASDVLRWNGTQTGNLNLLLNTSLSTSSPGMTIDITSGQTGSIAINRSSGNATNDLRLNSGASTFAMASGAGAFSVGTSGNGTNIVVGPSSVATHVATFTNNSTNDVTFGSNVKWVAGGGGNSTINFTFAGSGNFSLQSNLCGDVAPSARQITQNGTGVVTLSGNSTNISAVTVNSGTLQIGNGTDAGYLGSTTSPSGITNNGTLVYNVGAGNRTLGAAISGTGSLTQKSSGTLTLTGTNTYNGTTTITAGTLQIGNGTDAGSIASTSGITNNGALVYSVGAGNRTLGAAISGTGSLTQNGSGTLTLTGTNTYNGTTTISAGTLALGSAGAVGSTGNITFGGGALQFGANNTTDYSSRIKNSGSAIAIDTNGRNVSMAAIGSTNTGGLTKSGAGNLTLSGANTYNGNTTVSTGTLLINGSTAAGSAVNVSSGGTLGGNGTIGGAVTVNNGGFLAPGNSPGNLTIDNSLTLASGSAINMQLDGATPGTGYDRVTVTGSNSTITLAGNNDLQLSLTFSPTNNTLFFLIDNQGTSGISGTFAKLNGTVTDLSQGATFSITPGGQQFKISYAANVSANTFTGGNDLALQAVPEPTTWALLAFSLTTVMVLRRRRQS